MWRKRRQQDAAVDDVVDLRADDRSRDEYHCMTVHLNVAPVLDEAEEAWDEAGSLVSYSADLVDRRADRRREDLQPGQLSAAVLDEGELDLR